LPNPEFYFQFQFSCSLIFSMGAGICLTRGARGASEAQEAQEMRGEDKSK
jgi:hypothetical protein